MIPFNKPHLTGKETHYMYEAVSKGKLSGNGDFTKQCQSFFETKYGDITSPGIKITDKMTAQDVEKLREARRKAAKKQTKFYV